MMCLIGKGTNRPVTAPAAAPTPGIDTATIAQLVGHQGEQTGAVYKITVGRDDLKFNLARIPASGIHPCDPSARAPIASSAIAVSSFGNPSSSNPGAFVVAHGRSSSIAPLRPSGSRDFRTIVRVVASSSVRCGSSRSEKHTDKGASHRDHTGPDDKPTSDALLVRTSALHPDCPTSVEIDAGCDCRRRVKRALYRKGSHNFKDAHVHHQIFRRQGRRRSRNSPTMSAIAQPTLCNRGQNALGGPRYAGRVMKFDGMDWNPINGLRSSKHRQNASIETRLPVDCSGGRLSAG